MRMLYTKFMQMALLYTSVFLVLRFCDARGGKGYGTVNNCLLFVIALLDSYHYSPLPAAYFFGKIVFSLETYFVEAQIY